MFDSRNSGKIIKSVAQILFGLCVLGCIIGAIKCFVAFDDIVELRKNFRNGYGSNVSSNPYSSNALFWYGLLLLTVGPLVSYFLSLLLYSFGQVVEDVSATRYYTFNINEQPKPKPVSKTIIITKEKAKSSTPNDIKKIVKEITNETSENQDYWICKKCGTKNPSNKTFCTKCYKLK